MALEIQSAKIQTLSQVRRWIEKNSKILFWLERNSWKNARKISLSSLRQAHVFFSKVALFSDPGKNIMAEIYGARSVCFQQAVRFRMVSCESTIKNLFLGGDTKLEKYTGAGCYEVSILYTYHNHAGIMFRFCKSCLCLLVPLLQRPLDGTDSVQQLQCQNAEKISLEGVLVQGRNCESHEKGSGWKSLLFWSHQMSVLCWHMWGNILFRFCPCCTNVPKNFNLQKYMQPYNLLFWCRASVLLHFSVTLLPLSLAIAPSNRWSPLIIISSLSCPQ